jgi:hypothetical protein
MRHVRVLFLVTALIGLSSPARLDAQDDRAAAAAGRARMPDQAQADQHVASIESTRLAAEALGRAVEIDAARRVAPFDLDWGTP